MIRKPVEKQKPCAVFTAQGFCLVPYAMLLASSTFGNTYAHSHNVWQRIAAHVLC